MVRTSKGPTSGWRYIICSPRGSGECGRGPRLQRTKRHSQLSLSSRTPMVHFLLLNRLGSKWGSCSSDLTASDHLGSTPHASSTIQIGVGSGRVLRSAYLLCEALQSSAPQLQLQSVQLHQAAQIKSQNNKRIHARLSDIR